MKERTAVFWGRPKGAGEKKKYKTYPYRLEFVLFNGEDYYSTPGEMAYLASHLSRPEDYVCAFNVDGAGILPIRFMNVLKS